MMTVHARIAQEMRLLISFHWQHRPDPWLKFWPHIMLTPTVL